MNTYFNARTNIIERILETLHNGTGLTEQEMMHRFLISSFEVDQYISILLRSDLVAFDRKTMTYKINEQGIDLLNNIRQIYELDHVI